MPTSKRKTKILYLVTKGNWGGSQRYVFDLATSLPKADFDVLVAFGVPGELKGKLDEKGIRNITISELGRDISFLRDLKSFKALLRLFKKEQPDIIHLNSSKVGGLGALAARLFSLTATRSTPNALRIVFTAHGWPFWEDRSPTAKLVMKFFSWLTIIFSHKVITLHERDLHAFDYWPFTHNKIIKIYNGIKTEEFLSGVQARKNLSEKYGVVFGENTIGTIAELHRNKGLTYLIEAVRKLPETVSLVIIGEGEERKNLESLIHREHLNGRIFLTGFIPEAHKLLKAFDLFALTSIKEGFPFVLLEAGSANIPIIATTVGGIPEMIENKKEGLLVAPKNSDALFMAIQSLLQDKLACELYTSSFAKIIKELYNFPATTLPQTLALYHSTLYK